MCIRDSAKCPQFKEVRAAASNTTSMRTSGKLTPPSMDATKRACARRRIDCLHYCLSGVPQAWNVQLQRLLCDGPSFSFLAQHTACPAQQSCDEKAPQEERANAVDGRDKGREEEFTLQA
eukprot:827901-Prymnesium_polylepis.2